MIGQLEAMGHTPMDFVKFRNREETTDWKEDLKMIFM